MNKKRILVLLVMVILALSLTACTQSNKNEQSDSSAPTTEKPLEQSDGGNVLVAYFSNSGNTEETAQVIADKTGADLTEIQRAQEYGNLKDEAEAEIQNGEHPEIIVDIEDITKYDTIFVGYPIWFDEAPAMIATFLAENDFNGKTLIPFCTSSSDSIDNSLHIFEELCPDAEIAEGLTANDQADIDPWLEELELI